MILSIFQRSSPSKCSIISCITGNAGAGKTTLCQRLADKYCNGAYVRENADTPLLGQFYEYQTQNPGSYNPYALPLQIDSIESRFEQYKQVVSGSKMVIMDRCLLEINSIFVEISCENGYMSQEEIASFNESYNRLLEEMGHPDVIFFLKADISALYERVLKRGRECEVKNLSVDGLQTFENKYVKFIEELRNAHKDISVVVLDTTSISADEAYQSVSTEIDKLLEGY